MSWLAWLVEGPHRLIAAIHFNRGRVYIRHVLTHESYDQEDWKS